MDFNFYLAIETKPNNYFPINILDLNISNGFTTTKIAELDKFTLKFTVEEILSSIQEANLLELTEGMNLIVIYHEKNVVRKAPVLTKDITFDMWQNIKDNYSSRNFQNKIYNFLNGKVSNSNLATIKEAKDLDNFLPLIQNLPYFIQRKLYFYLYEN